MTDEAMFYFYLSTMVAGIFVAVLGLLRLRRENERLRDIVDSYERREREAAKRERTDPSRPTTRGE